MTLGYGAVSSTPISSIPASTAPAEPLSRVTPVNNFRIVSDRNGRLLVLGTGIFEFYMEIPGVSQNVMAGAAVVAVTFKSSAGEILAAAGGSDATAAFSESAVAQLTFVGTT